MFVENDVDFLDELGSFLRRRARFDVNLDEVTHLQNLLGHYNALRKKVYDAVIESQKSLASAPKEETTVTPEKKSRSIK